MKAEELMIGDWLFYKGQVAAFPFKVEQITKKKVGYHAEPCENRMHYLILSECDPIPLTPEILEKNGFKTEDDVHFSIQGQSDMLELLLVELPFDSYCFDIVRTEKTINKCNFCFN